MADERDKIRELESQLLRGELTTEQFEKRRAEIESGADRQVMSVVAPVVTEDGLALRGAGDDDLEIAAGPADEPGDFSSQLSADEVELDALTNLLRQPDPDAFDEDEPTDPEQGRALDEIEDFTLSMVLNTQGEIFIDRDLMLADDLDAISDEEFDGDDGESTGIAARFAARRLARKRAAGPTYSFTEGAPALLQVLLGIAAILAVLLMIVVGMVHTLGADRFACMVSHQVNTIGVWRLYYSNFPVGSCSGRATAVLEAAGELSDKPIADKQDTPKDEATDQAKRMHPLDSPAGLGEHLGPAEIVDDPETTTTASPYSDAGDQENILRDPKSGEELSPAQLADLRYCAEMKRVNSVDGWRDYLEHFPVGRCAERAAHFINTRAPRQNAASTGLKQRSNSTGPSDFLIDTIVLNDAAVRRCVRVARGRGRDVPQRMGIHFTIRSDGSVEGAQITEEELMGTSLDLCIGEQVNLLRFPPWNGEDRSLTYLLDLRRRATVAKRRPIKIEEFKPEAQEAAHEAAHGDKEDHGGDGDHGDGGGH